MAALTGLTPRLLEMDGGGVKGYGTAIFLTEVEKLTNQATRDLFSIMAGTSVGGLLSVGLSVPNEDGSAPAYKASQMVSLFEDNAEKIFPGGIVEGMWKVATLWGTWAPLYSPDGLESVMKEYCGETKVADLLGEISVMSVPSDGSGPVTFTRTLCRTDPLYADLKCTELVRMATAAPGIFSAHAKYDKEWVDAGTVDNMPLEHGIAQLRIEEGWSEKPIVLSLGAGRPADVGVSKFAVEHLGLAGWLRNYLNFQATGLADLQVSDLTAELGDQFLRMQFIVENVSIDDSSKANLAAIKAAAEEELEREEEPLRDFCKKLAPATFA